MAIPEYNYIPTYIKRTIANKPKDVVTASYWNELFNLLINQGDHTAEELGNVLNHFTTVITGVSSETADVIAEEHEYASAFEIHLSTNANPITADKTFAEIRQAIVDKREILLWVSEVQCLKPTCKAFEHTITLTVFDYSFDGPVVRADVYECYDENEWFIKQNIELAKQNNIGDIRDLTTTHKSDLVAAINEIKQTTDTKQDKLIAGENITIAADGKTISATSDVDDVIGYFRVTLTERGDGLYTGSKTFAQVKAEIESNKRFMFIDGYDCVLIVTRVGNALIEFAGMLDGTDGWLWVGVASDDRWEVVPEVRVTLDWYTALEDNIGKLTNLTTTDKTNLVAAVNEVKGIADDKQDKLIAGDNITIAADGKTISAAGGGGSVPKPLTYDYMPEGYPKKTMGTATIMEEQEVAFAHVANGIYGAFQTNALDIVRGQTYTVSWDGVEYECLCADNDKQRYLGNESIFGSGNDTGEPFLYDYYQNAFATLDTSPSHTISVKTEKEVITPMAEEFIPTMNVSTFTNDAGYLTLDTLPKYEGVVE